MTGIPPSHHYGQNDPGGYGGSGGRPEYGDYRDRPEYGEYRGRRDYGGQPDYGAYGQPVDYGEQGRQHSGYGEYGQYGDPATGRHHEPVELPVPAPPPVRRRRMGGWSIAVIAVASVALLVGVGFVVMTVIRPPVTPDEPPVAAAGDPATVRLGEKVTFRAGKISADYALTPGRPLTLTPSGSRPSRGAFLGLTAGVSVESGSVYLTDDNFVLITTEGREFEPDVSFLFEGGLRGARAAAGQTATGLVVWDIPPGSEVGARVALRIDDAVRGYWQLP